MIYLPKRLKQYAHPKLADQYRKRQRYRNYYGHLPDNRKVTRRRWTAEEDKQVIAHTVSDRELAEILNRTIPAIQQRRNALKELAL